MKTTEALSSNDSAFYRFDAITLDGNKVHMEDYRGKVVLVVNVASKCGFTPQYASLESMYRKYQDRGFTVLGFPCNQFMWQEPGDPGAIASFCKLHYDVSFPIFAKVCVNGRSTHPIFRFLKQQKPGLLGFGRIGWNFTKFLIDREGRVVERFSPMTHPDKIIPSLEHYLG